MARKHDLRFDAIIDRQDALVKPGGFGVRKLCEHFGASGVETVVVGDYLYDLLSAKAANTTAILLKNHKNTDFTKSSLDEILEILDNISNETKGSSNES